MIELLRTGIPVRVGIPRRAHGGMAWLGFPYFTVRLLSEDKDTMTVEFAYGGYRSAPARIVMNLINPRNLSILARYCITRHPCLEDVLRVWLENCWGEDFRDA